MKKKMIIIICSIVLIIGILITWFIISINNDKKKTLKRMDNIVSQYDKFKESVLEFNDNREKIYNEMFNDLYLDTIKSNYGVWISKLSEYEKFVDKVNKESFDLKKQCKNVYYPNQEINNKCRAFIIAYEEVNNYFVSDVDLFNRNIDSYNNEEESSLDKYKTKKIYIDFDGDKKYRGKEEISNE